jgi:hypothetical protein
MTPLVPPTEERGPASGAPLPTEESGLAGDASLRCGAPDLPIGGGSQLARPTADPSREATKLPLAWPVVLPSPHAVELLLAGRWRIPARPTGGRSIPGRPTRGGSQRWSSFSPDEHAPQARLLLLFALLPQFRSLPCSSSSNPNMCACNRPAQEDGERRRALAS